MRKREEVTKSERYFKILFLISKEINYNQILAQKLNMEPNALIEHLKFLKGKRYIFSKEQKLNNIQRYFINYKKLAEEFAQDIETTFLQSLSEDSPRYRDKEKINRGRELITEECRKIIKNPVLPELIKKFMINIKDPYDEDLINLQGLFVWIFSSLGKTPLISFSEKIPREQALLLHESIIKIRSI